MPQNIYDNPEFFANYEKLRASKPGLHEYLEQPALRSLLPNLRGKRALDMGCGVGDMSHWLVEQGVASVVGTDISEKMLAKARARPHPQITFLRSPAEDLDFPEASFDLVVSSLMFHYIEDLRPVFANIRHWLTDGGLLAFSTEHPIYTAAQGTAPGWEKGESGNNLAWRVDRYADEGKRVSTWFVDGVVRYHRTIATILNTLIGAGFRIMRVLEPYATEEAEKILPALLEERRRPTLLLIAAQAS